MPSDPNPSGRCGIRSAGGSASLSSRACTRAPVAMTLRMPAGGGAPVSEATLAEWLLPLSLATDAGAALPPGTASRTALLGLHAAALSNVKVDGAEVYFGALLRHLGCTSTAAS